MKHEAIIGCGFGDEGKGRVTSYLCSQIKPSLVIRFSGGHQAGHNVFNDKGANHVFSNFGSGSFLGIPTYWSKHCTIDPIGILNELNILKQKSCNPILFIDSQCPVTTPWDKESNIKYDLYHKHGSCGVGFGKTLEREENKYSLLFEDLFNQTVLEIKIELVQKYYSDINIKRWDFIDKCIELANTENIKITDGIPINDGIYIFEGSQGLLLDQDIGFFPHVSRTNCGYKNILDLVGYDANINLVTRAYQTRHGFGPMTNIEKDFSIKENPFEQNNSDNFQGQFRCSMLDLDLLKYALNKDKYIKISKKNLFITCIDLLENYRLSINKEIKTFNSRENFACFVKDSLGIDKIFLSSSPLFNEMNIL